jgi:hypothetical protein
MSVLELCLTSGGDGKKMRGLKKEGTEDRWAVYDFINAVCGRPVSDSYADMTFSRLVKDGSEHKDAVLSKCLDCKFPGARQRNTPTVTLKGLEHLSLILGGKVADEFRTLVTDTFNRVMVGDRSLIHVIEANAQSTSLVQQAFKKSLAKEPAAPTLEQICGVKRDRWDNLKFIKDSYEAYSMICSDTSMDERARLFFKDRVMNQVLLDDGGASAITNGPPASTPLTISNVASKMGMVLSTDRLQEVGFAVAKAYKQKYWEKPTKHEQLCGGAVRSVNSYMERDRALVEAVLATFK